MSQTEINYQVEQAKSYIERGGSFDFWLQSKAFMRTDEERIKAKIEREHGKRIQG